MTSPLFADKLAQLATKIADDVLADGVELDARIDAFKVLTAYWVGTRKVGSPADTDDDEGGHDFGSFQRKLAVASSRG